MSNEIKPAKPMRFNPVIDMEFEDPEVDLEFKTRVYVLSAIGQPNDVTTDLAEQAQEIEAYCNDGWQIDDKIICPPFAILIFSREKEEVKENDE